MVACRRAEQRRAHVSPFIRLLHTPHCRAAFDWSATAIASRLADTQTTHRKQTSTHALRPKRHVHVHDMSAAHASCLIHTDGARRVARQAGRRRRPHRTPLRRGARHARPAEQAARAAHRGGARLAAPPPWSDAYASPPPWSDALLFCVRTSASQTLRRGSVRPSASRSKVVCSYSRASPPWSDALLFIRESAAATHASGAPNVLPGAGRAGRRQ